MTKRHERALDRTFGLLTMYLIIGILYMGFGSLYHSTMGAYKALESSKNIYVESHKLMHEGCTVESAEAARACMEQQMRNFARELNDRLEKERARLDKLQERCY